MGNPFATVLLGLALAAVITVLLAAEFVTCADALRRRPSLPEADRPPTALPPLRAADVSAEAARGIGDLIRELRRSADSRQA